MYTFLVIMICIVIFWIFGSIDRQEADREFEKDWANYEAGIKARAEWIEKEKTLPPEDLNHEMDRLLGRRP